VRISLKVFQVVGAVAYLVAAQAGFSASTFVGLARSFDNGVFYLGGTQPFSTSMVYRWEVEPGNYLSVDTLGQTDWYIMPGLGLKDWDDERWLNNDGIVTILNLTISIENETGNLNFARTETINTLWPGGDGFGSFIPVTGAGTFTAINFTLTFDNVAPIYIGRPVDPLTGWSSYSPSSFSIGGSDGQGGYALATVVPEPSSGVLMVLGIGGVIALRRCRRSVV
jgi:hypothetical protein